MIKAICIGGPLDGVKRTILHGNRFTEIIEKETEVHWHGDWSTANTTGADDRANYRLETLRTDGGDISIWVPEDQTTLKTIEMLLQTYHQARGSK